MNNHIVTAVAGAANVAGTQRYRERFAQLAPDHFRQRFGLWMSSIGLGTYLGGADEQTDDGYVASIQAALRQGVNVIDTAINYRMMASERAVGRALAQLFASGEVQRDEVIVCTKGGYLAQDAALPAEHATNRVTKLAQRVVTSGLATPDEIVGGSHCIAPDYLSEQISASLENLRLQTLDIYYLHNPETQLDQASPDEFLERMRRAFVRLEEEATAGRIRFYGMATWQGFRVEEYERNYLPLFRLVKLAEEVGGPQHRFRFIQFPYNLGMPEAFTKRNQYIERADASGQLQRVQAPLLAAAVQYGIVAVTSASLRQTQVIGKVPDSVRRALGPWTFAGPVTDAQVAIHFNRSTPGVTTALVGMHRPEHVAENLALAAVPPLGQADFIKYFARRG